MPQDGAKPDRDPRDHTWSVRVRRTGPEVSRVYSGKNSFSVGKQASFSQDEPLPSAVDYLLGALGGDLLSGLERQASKRGITIEGAEAVVAGHLDNPLVFLGVVGSKGRPGFASIEATVYVGADAEEPVLNDAWSAALAVSPLVSTLERCVQLDLRLRLS
jgi:uncharacterized OsmC-like protein